MCGGENTISSTGDNENWNTIQIKTATKTNKNKCKNKCFYQILEHFCLLKGTIVKWYQTELSVIKYMYYVDVPMKLY